MDKKGGKHRESGFLVLQDQLTETRVCFGLQFEGAACRRRESPLGGTRGRWSRCIHRQEAESHGH